MKRKRLNADRPRFYASEYTSKRGARASVSADLIDWARLIADQPGARNRFWHEVSEALADSALAEMQAVRAAAATSSDPAAPAACEHPESARERGGTWCRACERNVEVTV